MSCKFLAPLTQGGLADVQPNALLADRLNKRVYVGMRLVGMDGAPSHSDAVRQKSPGQTPGLHEATPLAACPPASRTRSCVRASAAPFRGAIAALSFDALPRDPGPNLRAVPARRPPRPGVVHHRSRFPALHRGSGSSGAGRPP